MKRRIKTSAVKDDEIEQIQIVNLAWKEVVAVERVVTKRNDFRMIREEVVPAMAIGGIEVVIQIRRTDEI